MECRVLRKIVGLALVLSFLDGANVSDFSAFSAKSWNVTFYHFHLGSVVRIRNEISRRHEWHFESTCNFRTSSKTCNKRNVWHFGNDHCHRHFRRLWCQFILKWFFTFYNIYFLNRVSRFNAIIGRRKHVLQRKRWQRLEKHTHQDATWIVVRQNQRIVSKVFDGRHAQSIRFTTHRWSKGRFVCEIYRGNAHAILNS